jgi:TadE-like protein
MVPGTINRPCLPRFTKRTSYLFENRAQNGAVMVEAAIGSFLFFVVFFTFMDLGLYMYRQVSLQYAVNRAMRWATIGDVEMTTWGTGVRVSVDPLGYSSSDIKDYLIEQAESVGVELDAADIAICDSTSVGSCTTAVTQVGSLGVSDALAPVTTVPGVFVIQVERDLPLHFNFWLPATLPLRAHAVGRSEL